MKMAEIKRLVREKVAKCYDGEYGSRAVVRISDNARAIITMEKGDFPHCRIVDNYGLSLNGQKARYVSLEIEETAINTIVGIIDAREKGNQAS